MKSSITAYIIAGLVTVSAVVIGVKATANGSNISVASRTTNENFSEEQTAKIPENDYNEELSNEESQSQVTNVGIIDGNKDFANVNEKQLQEESYSEVASGVLEIDGHEMGVDIGISNTAISPIDYGNSNDENDSSIWFSRNDSSSDVDSSINDSSSDENSSTDSSKELTDEEQREIKAAEKREKLLAKASSRSGNQEEIDPEEETAREERRLERLKRKNSIEMETTGVDRLNDSINKSQTSKETVIVKEGKTYTLGGSDNNN